MRSLSALQQELEALEMLARADREKPYIPFPADFMLDTATIKGKVYHRKRPRLADGRAGKPEYISPQHHAELKEALASGRSLHQLEQDIKKLVTRIDRLSSAIAQRKQQATKKLEAQIDRLVGGVEAVQQGKKMRNLAGNDVSIFLFRFELHGSGIDFVLNEGIAADMYQDLDEQLKPLVHACCETLLRYRPLSISKIIMDGNILVWKLLPGHHHRVNGNQAEEVGGRAQGARLQPYAATPRRGTFS